MMHQNDMMSFFQTLFEKLFPYIFEFEQNDEKSAFFFIPIL